jgi:hypothetical protein
MFPELMLINHIQETSYYLQVTGKAITFRNLLTYEISDICLIASHPSLLKFVVVGTDT